jgi:hypothetical protein
MIDNRFHKERGVTMEYIVAVQRNSTGGIISVQTSKGRIISYQKALMEAEAGMLGGTEIQWNKDGNRILLNKMSEDIYFSDFPSIY